MTNTELRNQLEDLAFAVIEYGNATQERDFAPVYHIANMAITKLSLDIAMMQPDEEGEDK